MRCSTARTIVTPYTSHPMCSPLATPLLTPPHQHPHLPSSLAEIVDYAKWLGMDLDAEADLMWIAREGLKAAPFVSSLVSAHISSLVSAQLQTLYQLP